MIRRIRRISGILHGIVYSLPVLAFVVASYGRFGSFVIWPSLKGGSYFYLLLFTMLLWPVLADRYTLTSFNVLYTENTAIVRSLCAVGILLLGNATLLELSRSLIVSRIFLVTALASLFLLSVVVRFVFRRIVVRAHSKWVTPTNVLFVGTDKYAHWAAIRLNSAPLANCRISAYVALPGQETVVKGAPIVQLEEFENLRQLQIDSIFIAIGPDRFAELTNIYRALKTLAKPIYAVFDFGPRISIKEKFFQMGRLQVLNLEPSSTEGFGYSVVKRAFDIIFSCVALIVLSPIFGLIALLVKVTSPGPVFFRQERVGLNGQTFQMLKFRSMHCSGEHITDTSWTTKDNPRRTFIGKFLRRTSFDELPQLLNVLRGEMSLVGPRPERPHFVSVFRNEIERYDLRHRAKVGITGWAQVNGLRGDTSIRRRVSYDVYYLQHWSFAFDLRILFLTLRSIMFDRNAY